MAKSDAIIEDMWLDPRGYLEDVMQGFINDPPSSEFQRGYLMAILAVYAEALNASTALSAEAHLVLSKSGRTDNA